MFISHFGSGADRLLTTTLSSEFDSEVHFAGEESGMQWEGYLFELQNAVEWRMVMSRGPEERAQMHSMSYLLGTSSWIELLVRKVSGVCWP